MSAKVDIYAILDGDVSFRTRAPNRISGFLSFSM